MLAIALQSVGDGTFARDSRNNGGVNEKGLGVSVFAHQLRQSFCSLQARCLVRKPRLLFQFNRASLVLIQECFAVSPPLRAIASARKIRASIFLAVTAASFCRVPRHSEENLAICSFKRRLQRLLERSPCPSHRQSCCLLPACSVWRLAFGAFTKAY